MNEDELSAIEALANAATPGPWEVVPDPDKSYLDRVVRHYGHLTDLLAQCFHKNGNAAFIAACRDAVPALIAEVRRLRQELSDTNEEYRRDVLKLLFGTTPKNADTISKRLKGMW